MLKKIKYEIRSARARRKLKKLVRESELEIQLALRRFATREKVIELQEYICDNICRYPCTCRNEEHLMEVCEECQVEEFVDNIMKLTEMEIKDGK